jgi:subtilisin family serine protease
LTGHRSNRHTRRRAVLVSAIVGSLLVAGTASAAPQVADPAALRAVGPALEPTGQFPGTFLKGDPNSVESTSVVIKLDTQSVLSYTGGVAGLAATSPSVTGGEFDPNAPAVVAYRAYVNRRIDESVASLRSLVPDAEVVYRYDLVLAAFSARVPVASLDRLARVANVRAVLPDEVQQLDTYSTPDFIGAPSTWSQVGGQDLAGQGVVVGILDSGIWPEHPSFADNPSVAGGSYPEPPATWTGTACDFGAAGGPADASFSCNNKLIGAERFMSGYEALSGLAPYEFRSARDDDGHGTHTAGTAAGNGAAPAIGGVIDFGTMSGVAPRAHVAAYKVCGELGCFGTDSAAAIQQAIEDGVDVLNYSISGGSNPYGDVVALAFLDAYNAGVFVAASGGNSGPGADTVNHRAGWITTVAASTGNQAPLATVNLSGASGPLALTGVSITAGIATPAPVVVNTDSLCLDAAAPGTFTGQVVVCERGVIARTLKSANVAAGGAVGMILYNATASSTDGDAHSIPSVHLDAAEGAQLLSFLGANPGATARWDAPAIGAIRGDVLAGFSSRGGPDQSLGISKPDVTAPGVNILASYTSLEYGASVPPNAFLSGTSMSSPHVAGAAALLRDLHPTWTPGQIKSALMTTAMPAVLKEDKVTPATPFDTGTGRVDLAQAWNPGVTFDVSGQDYLDDAQQLWRTNYPSVYVPAMFGELTVERTARNTTSSPLQYQLSVEYPAGQPRDFTVGVTRNVQVAAGGSVTIPLSLQGRNVPLGDVRHAVVVMRRTGSSRTGLRMPVTIVRKSAPVTVSTSCSPVDIDRKGVTNCSVVTQNTTFTDAPVDVQATLSKELQLLPATVVGGTATRNVVRSSGVLAGAEPPAPSIAPGTSPAGYLPLSIFGISPIAGVGDETISNFTVPEFVYAGRTYNRIGVVSNGYVVVGGGTGADVDFINQSLPSPDRPNNVLAPFWTDLNPSAGGSMRVGTLTDGVNTWLVVDWAAVREYSSTNTASFQIWIGLNGSEDISFTYGTIQGNGDSGFLTVGAENEFGNRGGNAYFNGTGTLPAAGTVLKVTSVPGAPGASRTMSFSAEGFQTGRYTVTAQATSALLDHTAVATFSGEVRRK